MSDWELTSESSYPKAKPGKMNSKPVAESDWKLSNQEPAESFSKSVGMAIPRIANDLYEKGYEALQKAPDYLKKAKTEVPGFLNPMNWAGHPMERGKQTLAGLLEGAQGINQLPRSLAQYGANRLHLISPESANKVPQALNLNEDIEKYLGNPKNPGDALARGVGRNALGLIPGGQAVTALNPLKLLMTKKNIKNTLLNAHDFLENRASNAFKHVSNEVHNRGISQIPIFSKDKNIPIEKGGFGNQFWVSHNSGNTVMPTNVVSMIKDGNNARVISSKVDLNDRGKGLGKSLYKSAIEDAQNKGLGFESDSAVSHEAMNVYKALEKEGYKFKFDRKMKPTNIKHEGNNYKGWESHDGESPVVQLIHAPKKVIAAGEHLQPNFFESIKHYFPDTRASADLLSKAKTGDYNSLRKLQGDLYKRAKKNLSSDFEADNLKGSEMLEKREDINQLISNHLHNTESHDLNHILNGGREDWRTLQQTYYNENMNKSLMKMFDKNVRKVPNNLVKLLDEESIPMKNLFEFHPGLGQKVTGYKRGQGALKKVFKYGVPTATAIAGYEYGNHKH